MVASEGDGRRGKGSGGEEFQGQSPSGSCGEFRGVERAGSAAWGRGGGDQVIQILTRGSEKALERF